MKRLLALLALLCALPATAAPPDYQLPFACGAPRNVVASYEPMFLDVADGCAYKCAGGVWSLVSCPAVGPGDLTVSSLTCNNATAAPGNLVSIAENSITSFPTTCASLSGFTNRLTFIDTVNTAGVQSWEGCMGNQRGFVFPDMRGDASPQIQNNEVLVGTGPGTGQFETVASVAGTVKDYDGSSTPRVVTSPSTLKFPNGTVVDETGGVGRIETFGSILHWQADQWYDSGNIWNTADVYTSFTLSVGSAYYVPFYTPHQITIKAFGFWTGTSSPGGNAKLCIYDSLTSTGKPNARVYNGSASPITVTASTNQEHGVPGFTPITLNPGWYDFFISSDAAITVWEAPSGQNKGVPAVLGWNNLGSSSIRNRSWVEMIAYGSACPATAGTLTLDNHGIRLGVKGN